VVAFAPVFRAEFVDWDDLAMIRDNARLLHPTGESLAAFWKDAFLDLYFPLTSTVWWTIAKLSPRDASQAAALNPLAFHAASVVAHALSALVVFAILRRLLGRRCDWAACAGAMIFALHPVQVESVAWASALKDVLCGLLSLVALWQYLCFAQAEDGARAGVIHYAIALLAAAAAVLAKPTAVVLPLMILAVAFIALRRQPWPLVARDAAAFFVLAIGGAALAAHFQKAPGLTTSVSMPLRPLVALDALGFYLRKLLVPMNLAVDYGRTPRAVLESGALWMSWLAPVALVAIVVMLRRRTPLLGLAACIFTAPLLPVLGLVPFDYQEFSTVADHYLYLSMLGVALALAIAMVHLPRQANIAIAVVLIGALGAMSFAQSQRWHDSDVMLHHTIDVNPRSWMAMNNLANLEVQNQQWADAEAHARQSIDIKGNYAPSRVNLGCALLNRGEVLGAIEQFQAAIALDGQLVEAHMNLGMAYGRMGRIDLAIAEFEAAARVDPNYAPARQMLERLAPYRQEPVPPSHP
jgi:tetratricopeptide (TPR) repeat protein